jgi:hypothetical protein
MPTLSRTRSSDADAIAASLRRHHSTSMSARPNPRAGSGARDSRADRMPAACMNARTPPAECSAWCVPSVPHGISVPRANVPQPVAHPWHLATLNGRLRYSSRAEHGALRLRFPGWSRESGLAVGAVLLALPGLEPLRRESARSRCNGRWPRRWCRRETPHGIRTSPDTGRVV